MLYTLIGNGNHNQKEVLGTLRSLRDSAEASGDEFWMLFVEEATPSPAVTAIVGWVQEKNIYYEIVRTSDASLDSTLYTKAQEEHSARRPVDRAVSLTPARVEIDERCAILILSDDLDSDDEALYAVTKAIDLDVPVYDLAGQMTPLQVEEPEATPEALPDEPEPEPEPAPVEAESGSAAQLYPLTRDELADLTAAELRALVRDHEIESDVTDMRSKDAMTSALLKHWGLIEPEREITAEDLPAHTQSIEPTIPGTVIIEPGSPKSPRGLVYTDTVEPGEMLGVEEVSDTRVVRVSSEQNKMYDPDTTLNMVSVPRYYVMAVDQHGNLTSTFITPEQMAVIRTALSIV